MDTFVLRGIDRRRGLATQDVDPISHGLKVRRINASTVPAQVINDAATRDWVYQKRVRKPMRTAAPFVTELPVAITV